MPSDKISHVRRMLAVRRPEEAPIRVRLRCYLEFSRRLDAQLQKLVARWGPKSQTRRRA